MKTESPESAPAAQKQPHQAQKLLEALGVNHDSGGVCLLVSGEIQENDQSGKPVGTFQPDGDVTYAWIDLIIRGDTPRINIEAGSVEHQELNKLRGGDRVIIACTAKYDAKLKKYTAHRNGRLICVVS